MSKKKVFLSNQKKDELAGFEEVLDLAGLDKGQIHGNKDAQIEDYEIYDFLEKENLRLEKLDHFFSTQMPLERKYSQTNKLIEKEAEALALVKDELTNEITRSDSHFSHYLNELLDKAFSN